MLFTYFHSNRATKTRNRILIPFLFLIILTICTSCNKEKYDEHPATVQVFNALDDGISLYANLSGNHPVRYNTSLGITNKFYTLTGGVIYVNNFPQKMDFYSQKDTMPHDRPVISTTPDLTAGEIYSLFIYGGKSAATYSLFNDKLPAINKEDSTTHIRFANFGEAQAISVNLQGQAAGSFIQNLAFKSLSDFIELNADASVRDYVFELRDQATGDLLTTYTTIGLQPVTSSAVPNNWIAKSNTLVLTGRPGGTAPNNPRVVIMNHR